MPAPRKTFHAAREPAPSNFRSLKEWLLLSWLYPEDFGTPELTVDGTDICVVGTDYTYQFVLGSRRHSQSDAFGRWLLACEEVANHRLWAPRQYSGVRALTWADGEPRWLHSEPTHDFEPPASEHVPYDIAVVRRNLDTRNRLDNILQANDAGKDEYISLLARRLAHVHREQSTRLRQEGSLATHASSSARILKQESIRTAEILSSVAPLSIPALLCAEVSTRLKRGVAQTAKIRDERLLSGHIGSAHGALRLSRVYKDPKNGRPLFTNCLPDTEMRRETDALFDVAALSLDLMQTTSFRLGKRFISEYRRNHAEAWNDELFDLNMLQAAQFFCSEHVDQDQDDMSEEFLSSLLGATLRYIRKIDSPRIFILSGDEQSAIACSNGLASILSCQQFQLSDNTNALQEWYFDFYPNVRRQLRNTNALVLTVPKLSRRFLEIVNSLSKSTGAAHAIFEIGTNQRTHFINPEWQRMKTMKVIPLDADMPVPELCSEILAISRSSQ